MVHYVGSVKNPRTFVKGEIGEPRSFDPAIAYDTRSWEVIANTYETLVTYSLSRRRFTPLLATTVPTVENGLIRDGGRTYVLPIRSGVRFHNGEPLTPEDVAYSLRRLMITDAPGGPSWLLLEPLLGVRSMRSGSGALAVDPERLFQAIRAEGDAVVISLQKPFAPFLSILSTPATSIISKNWAVARGEWPGTPATVPEFVGRTPEQSALTEQCMGTGPFRLKEWARGRYVELERNEDYWREPAFFEKVRIVKENDWAGRKAMLLAGDADMVQTDRVHVPEILNLPGIRVYDDLPILVCDGVGFNFKINTANNPRVGSGQLDGQGVPADFFADVHVRRGFNYAFDWDRLIRETYHGKAKQMLGPIPEGIFGFNPDVPRYFYDRAVAEREFRRAFGGRLWETGFYMQVQFNDGNLLRAAAVKMLKQNVEAINPRFRIEIQAVDLPEYLRGLQEGYLTLFTTGWLVDYPDPHDFAYPILSAGGLYGAARNYHNPELEAMIEAGATAADPEERRQIYFQIQQYCYDQAIEIFTVQPVGLAVLRDWVHGWEHDLITGPQAVTNFYTLVKE